MVSLMLRPESCPLTPAGVRSHEAKAIMKSKMKLGDKVSYVSQIVCTIADSHIRSCSIIVTVKCPEYSLWPK